jgi:hypothetical protein
MAEQEELTSALARLEAALAAAQGAVDAIAPPEDRSAEIDELRARAEAAEMRAAAAEAELDALRSAPPAEGEPDRLRAALGELEGTLDGLREGHDGAVDASLAAEVEALRAARALDLAEIEALLKDLEPLLEPAHA